MDITSRLFVSIIAVFVISVPVFAEGWKIDIVDGQFGSGLYNSIAVDSSDNPDIAYFYSVFQVGDALRFASYNGKEWEIENVIEDERKGLFVSLALDRYDYPRMTCTEGYPPLDLYYVKSNQTGWTVETVDSPGQVGFYCSIALDIAGAPHISYLDTTNHDLKYAYKDCLGPDKWEIETVDSDGIVGEETSLALDGNRYPHIAYAYFHDATRDLKYARWDGKKWIKETVDSSLGFCLPSLALDSSGYPHIAYHDFENGYLKYARWSGVTWQIEIVDKDSTYGGTPSLALDVNDYPHITFHDYNTNYLKYACWCDNTWQIEKIDDLIGTGSVYISKSIALDSDDNPHISYYDSYNSRLKYARRIEDAKGYKEITDGGIPTAFCLGPAYPNPSNGSATIEFALPHECTVNLNIYDIKGRKVREVINGEMAAGDYERTVSELSSGLYVYRLQADGFVANKKIIVE